MRIKRLIYVLVPIIALSPSAMANTEGESDDIGIIISKRETTTSPVGFSSVAEPAGPSDTKSTEQSPETSSPFNLYFADTYGATSN